MSGSRNEEGESIILLWLSEVRPDLYSQVVEGVNQVEFPCQFVKNLRFQMLTRPLPVVPPAKSLFKLQPRMETDEDIQVFSTR